MITVAGLIADAERFERVASRATKEARRTWLQERADEKRLRAEELRQAVAEAFGESR